MPEDEHLRHDEWRFGGEPHEAPQPPVPPAPPIPVGRLDRQLFVVTTEHLGWAIVVLYTIISRIIALAARPLSADEARRALLELASVRVAIPPDAALAIYPSWIDIGERWVFAAFGAGDSSSRIVVALCGIILVLAAYWMRPYIGRAGALALAAMLTISPTATYLARGGSSVVPAMAFMLITIVLALSLGRMPFAPRAAAIGLAIALWLTAAPVAVISGLTLVVALIPIGLFTMVVSDNRWLRFRVWWERRRSMVLIATLTALFVGYYLATAMLSRRFLEGVGYDLASLQILRSWSFEPGLIFYLPALGFYEFLIVILALVGIVVTIVSARCRLAAFAIVWIIVNTAVFLAMPARQMEFLLPILIPPALVAAIGIESLAMSAAWPAVRVAVAALGWLTIYVAALVNFIYATPDASQASWRRNLLIYWREPATTIQTRRECYRIMTSEAGYSQMTLWVPPDAPQVSWYLNKMRLAPDRASAQIAFSPAPAAGVSIEPGARRFGIEESWNPDPAKVTITNAARYLFTMRPWTDEVTYRDMQIVFHTEQPSAAATPVPAPSPVIAPSPSPTPTSTPSPAASASPEATTTTEPTIEPTPSPVASPSEAPSQIGSPAATPTSANL